MTSGDAPSSRTGAPGSAGPVPGYSPAAQPTLPARPPVPQQHSAPPNPPPYLQQPYPVVLYPATVWVPTAAPAKRSSRAAVLALAIALVVALVGVGGLTAYARRAGAFRAAPAWHVTVPQDPPPAADAPAADWTAWATRSVGQTVQAQGRALLAGDEAAFSEITSPSDEALAANLHRRYAVLRALHPGVWIEKLGEIKSSGNLAWSAEIKISYCFGDSACIPADLTETSRWSVLDDRVVLASLTSAKGDQQAPRPWENDDLLVRQGQRVIVATTKINEYRLESAVTAADEAAKVADTFARWGPVPNRYVVFLAATKEWASWYGGNAPAWAAGWTVQVAGDASEVMISTDQVGPRDLQTLLTHEFTHVTTLPGATTTSKSWWLVEGIAEYAMMLGKPTIAYDKYQPTRDYVHKGWDGQPGISPPSTRATDADAAAHYGVAFLSVRRIADKYSHEKLLDFFDQVVHKHVSLDTAARSALGTSWSTVSADLTSSIRKAMA